MEENWEVLPDKEDGKPNVAYTVNLDFYDFTAYNCIVGFPRTSFGDSMKFRRHTLAEKERWVRRYITTRLSLAEVATEAGIHRETLRLWVRKFRRGEPLVPEPEPKD